MQFIIGLNLLFTIFQGCLLTPTSLHFLTFPSLCVTSEFAQKRGGSLPNPNPTSCCQTCSTCSKQQTPVECLENHQIVEYKEPFQYSTLYLKLLEIPHEHFYMINPSYLYNLLSSGNLEIDDILSKLAKEEIIGENPGKHWEKNRLICKLELKDSEFRIQNKKIESTNENLKEFELHINELLKL